MPGLHRPLRSWLLCAGLLLAGVRTPCAEPAPGPSDPSTEAVADEIDRLVLARLRMLGISPAPVCADEVFVRRAFLDVIGTIPTAAETRAFLADKAPTRRAALVDRLLARDEFADYWAMKWCNLLRVKSEFPINLWPNAVQAYHRWIRTSVKQNLPYDRFARELLTANGSNFRAPQVNFWRAVQSKDPPSLARAVALTFLGARADAWPKERVDGLAAFFARIGYKATAEWKEEIVFWDAAKADAPAQGVLPDGTPVALGPDKDPRAVFSDWLLAAGNPWFARAIANRVWSWFLGTGVVHEPDDLRADNPPANAALLACLERAVVAFGWDLRRLFRAVLLSKTYQRSSVPAANHARAEAEFACYAVRRLEAEVLIDAVNQITGTTEEYVSKIPEPFTVMPAGQRAISLPDASVTSPFLELFGRSARDTGLEAEQRGALPTAAQALHLLNSSHVRRKLEEGPALRTLLVQHARNPKDALDAVYLTVLSRYPTDDDRKAVAAYRASQGPSPRVAVDVVWALVNSAEFQFRH